MILTCEQCAVEFERPGKRGPRPRFCSIRCRGRWAYHQPHIKAYQQAYSQRPERQAAHAARSRARYATPEYQKWARNRYRQANFVGVEIPAPYTGHRWLDMARQAVTGGNYVDPAFRDFGYDDEMGEAVLALLEGRDMNDAVKDYRRREYVPRHLTLRAGDWVDDGHEDKWFDSQFQVPSAEDEVLAGEAIQLELKARVNWSTNSARRLRAGSRKGGRGPNRSHERFRGRHGDGHTGQEERAA